MHKRKVEKEVQISVCFFGLAKRVGADFCSVVVGVRCEAWVRVVGYFNEFHERSRSATRVHAGGGRVQDHRTPVFKALDGRYLLLDADAALASPVSNDPNTKRFPLP